MGDLRRVHLQPRQDGPCFYSGLSSSPLRDRPLVLRSLARRTCAHLGLPSFRQVALWSQRLRAPQVVVWDYHVVLVLRAAASAGRAYPGPRDLPGDREACGPSPPAPPRGPEPPHAHPQTPAATATSAYAHAQPCAEREREHGDPQPTVSHAAASTSAWVYDFDTTLAVPSSWRGTPCLTVSEPRAPAHGGHARSAVSVSIAFDACCSRFPLTMRLGAHDPMMGHTFRDVACVRSRPSSLSHLSAHAVSTIASDHRGYVWLERGMSGCAPWDLVATYSNMLETERVLIAATYGPFRRGLHMFLRTLTRTLLHRICSRDVPVRVRRGAEGLDRRPVPQVHSQPCMP